MNRRVLLKSLAVASTAGLAGCPEQTGSLEGIDTSPTETATETGTEQSTASPTQAQPTPDGIVRENTEGDIFQSAVVTDAPGEFSADSTISVTGSVSMHIADAQDNIIYGAVGTSDGELYGLARMQTTGSGTVTVSARIPETATDETLIWTFVPATSESAARRQYQQEASNGRYQPGDLAIQLGTVTAAEGEREPGRIYRETPEGEAFQSGTVTDAPDEFRAGSSISVTGDIRVEIDDAQDNIIYGAVGTPDGELYGLTRMSTTGSGTVTVSAALPEDATGDALIWTFVPATSETAARSQYHEEAANGRYQVGDLAISLGTVE